MNTQPHNQPHVHLLALTLALAYLLVIVYASLQPLRGWRMPAAEVYGFLTAPWPPYITLADVLVNVAAYVPLGFMLALGAALERRAGQPERKKVTFAWNPEDVLKICASLLEPGGEVMHLDFRPQGRWMEFLLDGHAVRNNEGFMPAFNRIDMHAALRDAGFTDMSIEPFAETEGATRPDWPYWRFPWMLFRGVKPR